VAGRGRCFVILFLRRCLLRRSPDAAEPRDVSDRSSVRAQATWSKPNAENIRGKPATSRETDLAAARGSLRLHPDAEFDRTGLGIPATKSRLSACLYRRFGPPTHMVRRIRVGGCGPFVDPRLSALDAPVCWRPDTGVAILSAKATHTPINGHADLTLSKLSCLQHIVDRGRQTRQRLLLHTTDLSIAIDLRGDSITEAPVNVTFQVDGLAAAPRFGELLTKLPQLLSSKLRRTVSTVQRLLLRDGLIALDGRQAGASYRDMAEVIFGPEQTTAAWGGPSRNTKDRMARALAKAEALTAGGYLHLFA
jgi:hypothetical protein